MSFTTDESTEHTKLNLYQCKLCEKAFHQKAILIQHVKIHTEENSYQCELCNKTFTLKKI